MSKLASIFIGSMALIFFAGFWTMIVTGDPAWFAGGMVFVILASGVAAFYMLIEFALGIGLYSSDYES